MHYLLLWTGDIAGMKKTRIASQPSRGMTGTWFHGALLKPNLDAIHTALPYRLRAAFDRTDGVIWFDRHNNASPARIDMMTRKGKQITLYLQPLLDEAG